MAAIRAETWRVRTAPSPHTRGLAATSTQRQGFASRVGLPIAIRGIRHYSRRSKRHKRTLHIGRWVGSRLTRSVAVSTRRTRLSRRSLRVNVPINWEAQDDALKALPQECTATA